MTADCYHDVLSYDQHLGVAQQNNLGKFNHDLTVLPHQESLVFIGKSSPFMAEQIRLVNWYYLPSGKLTLWKIAMFYEKLTLSMAMFNGYVTNYQTVLRNNENLAELVKLDRIMERSRNTRI